MRPRRYPASIVKEYAWCPVAAWLAANLEYTPQPTPRMIEGREWHAKLQEILERHGYRDAKPLPPLHSKRWPLTATPDAYSPSKRELIEVKKTAKTNQRIYRVQAMLYAAIAAENNVPVENVTLIGVEDNTRITIPVDAALHETIEKIVEATLRVIREPLPPPPPPHPNPCQTFTRRRFFPAK